LAAGLQPDPLVQFMHSPKPSGGPASKRRERMGRRIEGTEPTYKGREATGEGLLLRRKGGKGGERG